MSNHILIWAGGPEYLFPPAKVMVQLKKEVDIWIGADRGALHLLDWGLTPCLSIGDFDSVSEDEYEYIEKGSQRVENHPAEKNETDLEIAISEALKRNVTQLTLVGVTGGRMDHQMMTMQLMEKIAMKGIVVDLYEQSGRVWIWPPGVYELRESHSAYVSFLPVSDRVDGLSLNGFKYDTNDVCLYHASSLCISNKQTKTVAEVSFHKGLLYGVTASE